MIDKGSIKKLKDLAKSKSVPMEQVLDRFKVSQVEELTMKNYVDAVQALNNTERRK